MFFFSIKKDMKIHLYEKKSSTHVFMEIKKENNNNFATSQLIFFDNIDVFLLILKEKDLFVQFLYETF